MSGRSGIPPFPRLFFNTRLPSGRPVYENWEEDDDTDYCTAAADLADAQAVCDKLGIKLHKSILRQNIGITCLNIFLTEYKAGRTPKPRYFVQ